jgi:putative hydroxymethylpyrimidine transport system ATP-binding protein
MHSQTTSPTVTIRNASIAFNGRLLFEKLNFTLKAGKWTCLLGPSGIGKSTLLRLIANLSSPGTLLNADIQSDNGIPLSRQIAYMGQTDLLLPWLSVLDNVLLGSRLRSYSASEKLTLQTKAKELLTLVGLQAAECAYPKNLSGGMRQRVALVRTLIEDKPIVLMDEPFSALDAITRFKLQNLAADLLRHKTLLFITHDPVEALRLADEIYILSGLPATLSQPLKIATLTPRTATTPELILLQEKLFLDLSAAHEVSA